jgi:hypothetical protein
MHSYTAKEIGSVFGFSPPARAVGQRTSTVTITSNGGSPTVALTGIRSIAACGGSRTSTKQPQNYTVTFTATTGSSKQTIHFMLTVNEDTRTIMSRARNVRRRNCLW